MRNKIAAHRAELVTNQSDKLRLASQCSTSSKGRATTSGDDGTPHLQN
jgi:hypothetical protein